MTLRVRLPDSAMTGLVSRPDDQYCGGQGNDIGMVGA